MLETQPFSGRGTRLRKASEWGSVNTSYLGRETGFTEGEERVCRRDSLLLALNVQGARRLRTDSRIYCTLVVAFSSLCGTCKQHIDPESHDRRRTATDTRIREYFRARWDFCELLPHWNNGMHMVTTRRDADPEFWQSLRNATRLARGEEECESRSGMGSKGTYAE